MSTTWPMLSGWATAVSILVGRDSQTLALAPVWPWSGLVRQG